MKEYLSGRIDKTMFGSLMYYLKDYYRNCCKSAGRLVEGYDSTKEEQHVSEIFDEWIRLYDLKDEYPLDETLNTVYRRKFVGPVQQFSDYRYTGYGEVIDEYQKAIGKNPFAMMGVTDTITNLIDGRNTVGEIIRKTSLEKRKDEKDAVLVILKLYEGLNLIEKI